MDENKVQWIGVDLDGTLAYYDTWRGAEHIGDPIPAMLQRVREWIAKGYEVRIFTARANEPEKIPYVQAWLEKYGLGGLKITNIKDHGLIALYDDRCYRVEKNTGKVFRTYL